MGTIEYRLLRTYYVKDVCMHVGCVYMYVCMNTVCVQLHVQVFHKRLTIH